LSLEEKIWSNQDFLRDHLPTKPVNVGRFLLPNFKLCFHGKLRGVLENLGIKNVLPARAELQDIILAGWLFLLSPTIHFN
jgi:hypothetical protein